MLKTLVAPIRPALVALAICGMGLQAAHGLSELAPEDAAPTITEDAPGTEPTPPVVVPDLTPPGTEVDRAPLEPVPLPDPIPSVPGLASEPAPDVTGGDITQRVVAPGENLPEPVQRMHDLIVEAARSGDPEALRPLMGTANSRTQLSFGDPVDDPITFLKSLSGDGEGRETLAIMLDLLALRPAEMTSQDGKLYVFPYFVAKNLDTLSPPEMVELFTVVTAGDFDSMREFGAYNFYRIGITAEGEWVFFVAGD